MTTMRMGELFREAIRFGASSIVLAHNHPSGDPEPSNQDVEVTCQIKKVSNIIQIELVDHLIVGDQRWVSLREEGRF